MYDCIQHVLQGSLANDSLHSLQYNYTAESDRAKLDAVVRRSLLHAKVQQPLYTEYEVCT